MQIVREFNRSDRNRRPTKETPHFLILGAFGKLGVPGGLCVRADKISLPVRLAPIRKL